MNVSEQVLEVEAGQKLQWEVMRGEKGQTRLPRALGMFFQARNF